jgi:hypothetical protein
VAYSPFTTPPDLTPTLVVLLHGLRGGAAQMAQIGDLARVAIPGAAVIAPEYRARTFSNADPARVAAAVDEEVERYHAHWRSRHVVLLGYSIGAELLRRAYLNGVDRGAAWVGAVDRLVLVGSVRDGWTVDPARHAMPRRTRAAIRLASALARTLGIGRLARSFERGAPFVTELASGWRAAEERGTAPMVVEVVGEIDEAVARVSDAAGTPRRQPTVVRVRGSTHRDILIVDTHGDPADPSTWRRADDPRRERRSALTAALTAPASELRTLARRRIPRDVIPFGPGLGARGA